MTLRFVYVGIGTIIGFTAYLIYLFNKEKLLQRTSVNNIKRFNALIDDNSGRSDLDEIFVEFDNDKLLQRLIRSGKTAILANVHFKSDSIRVESESYFFQYNNQISTIIRSFTVIGLVFTFLGLVFSIKSSSDVLNTISNSAEIKNELNLLVTPEEIPGNSNISRNSSENFDKILMGLKNTLGGVYLAFITSLIGLIFSLFFGIYFSNRTKKNNLIVEEMVHELSLRMLPLFSYNNPDSKLGSLFDKLVKKITSALEGFNSLHFQQLKEFSDKIEKYFEELKTKNAELILETTKEFKSLNNEYIAIAKSTKDSFKEVKTFADTVKASSTEIHNAAIKFNKHISNFEKLSTPLEKINTNIIWFSAGLNTFFRALEKLSMNDPANVAHLNNIQKIMTSVNESIKDILDATKNKNNNEDIVQKLDELLVESKLFLNELPQKFGVSEKTFLQLNSLESISKNLSNFLPVIQMTMSDSIKSNKEIINELSLFNKKLTTISKSPSSSDEHRNGHNWLTGLYYKLFPPKIKR